MAARSSSYRGRMWGQHATAVALRRPRVRTFARSAVGRRVHDGPRRRLPGAHDARAARAHGPADPARVVVRAVRRRERDRRRVLPPPGRRHAARRALASRRAGRERPVRRAVGRDPVVRRRSSPGTSAWRRATTCPSARPATSCRPGRCSWPAGARSCTTASTPRASRRTRTQFDSDITVGRYPRAALGINRDWILAVACDGRGPHDAGMTLRELAELMVTLGRRPRDQPRRRRLDLARPRRSAAERPARGARDRAGGRPARSPTRSSSTPILKGSDPFRNRGPLRSSGDLKPPRADGPDVLPTRRLCTGHALPGRARCPSTGGTRRCWPARSAGRATTRTRARSSRGSTSCRSHTTTRSRPTTR